MHERTQRAIARLVFVFCCAVPTALTLFWLLVTWTPWYHQRALRLLTARLSHDTGMVIEVDDFQRTAPSTLQLCGVRVLQPETGREVARVRELQWISRADEVSILLHQPELQSRELASAWQMIHDRFLCRPEHTGLPVRVAGNDLTIHSVTGALTLLDLDAWIRPHDDAVEATIQCLPANSSPDAAPVSITARRERSGQMPTTQWMIDTHDTALPCSALAEFLPALESLGSDAMFSGTMRWQLQSKHWWMDLGGSHFDQVSLDRLFEQHSHRMSGSATIHLERCRIDPHRRRSDVAGSIRASDGFVGRSLLISASRHLDFQVQIPRGLVEPEGDIPYDRIAIGFNINNTQLQLRGTCRREVGYESFSAGVVLCLDGYPVVLSSGKTLDSIRMIAAMAPSHSVPVPLANQTSWMTSVFIPPSRPLPRGEPSPPRIRSAENWRAGPTIAQPH